MEKTNSFAELFKKYWITVLIAAQPVLDILAYWTRSPEGTAAGMLRLAIMLILPLHLLITSAVGVPVCLYCWMPASRAGAAWLAGSWVFCYAATWLSQYLLYRHRVRALDRKIKAVNLEDEHERH